MLFIYNCKHFLDFFEISRANIWYSSWVSIYKIKTTSLSVAIKRGTKECSSHASRG